MTYDYDLTCDGFQPLWVLKTAKEKHMQRVVHMSTDLARQVGTTLENVQTEVARKESGGANVAQDAQNRRSKTCYEERQRLVSSAKNGVRNRRGRRMQASSSIILVSFFSHIDFGCTCRLKEFLM